MWCERPARPVPLRRAACPSPLSRTRQFTAGRSARYPMARHRSPLARRALMQPLLKRLEEARKVGVQRRMLDLATTLVRSCQAEQSVVAQLTLCKVRARPAAPGPRPWSDASPRFVQRIPTAAPSHDRDVARLLEAAAVLRRLDAQSPLLAEAVLLGRRMRAEVRHAPACPPAKSCRRITCTPLRAASPAAATQIDLQLAMQAPVVREDGTYALVWAPAGASSSAEGGLRGHPTVVGNQLLALRARVPRLAKVMVGTRCCRSCGALCANSPACAPAGGGRRRRGGERHAAACGRGLAEGSQEEGSSGVRPPVCLRRMTHTCRCQLTEAEAMEAERLRLEEEERLKREKKKKKKKKPKK